MIGSEPAPSRETPCGAPRKAPHGNPHGAPRETLSESPREAPREASDAAARAALPAKGPWERYGWLMAAIWMVFLLFPASALFESQAALPLRAVGWIGLVCFGAGYITGFAIGMRAGWRRATRRVIVLFWAVAAAAILTIPAIGWEVTSFLPFLMAYASYGIGATWHWCVTIASVLLMVGYVVLDLVRGETPVWFLGGVVVMMAAVNTINTWLLDRSVAADELRMELATSEERESVARDVHDLLGHSLTVVKLKTELAARLIERDPAAARAELEAIARITGEAIADVRGTVTGLRSEGLASQLNASRAALESAGIAVEVAGDTAALSTAQGLAASWILREATTNVLRHAAARSVRIEVEPGVLTIEDDGVGLRTRSGNGLRGMAERAAAAGAVLRLEQARAGGTRVSVTW